LGEWYEVAVTLDGKDLYGYLNGELKLAYTADNLLHGFVGLWSRADSVSFFEDLQIDNDLLTENDPALQVLQADGAQLSGQQKTH
jgi:hypothetical protein